MKTSYCKSFSMLGIAALCILPRAGSAQTVAASASAVATVSPEAGFTRIFNGKDLTGWDGNPKLWSAENGSLVGHTTAEAPLKKNTFLIWTNGTVADFELRCSFKIVPENNVGFANSGIQYRSKVLEPADWVVGGYQADMEAGPTYTGILYEERMTRGIMAARGEKVVWDSNCKKQVVGSFGTAEELGATIKKGDWNDYVIIAKGNHLQHFINGRQMVDVVDECESKRASKGVLALQLHAGQPMRVEFRNLRLKTLGGADAAVDDELKALQGDWQVVSMIANGDEVDPETATNIVVQIRQNTYKVLNTDRGDSGTFTVDSTTSPRSMKIKPDRGPDSGEAIPAIYEMTGDTMRICYGRPGEARPVSFKAEAGQFLINYKKKSAE